MLCLRMKLNWEASVYQWRITRPRSEAVTSSDRSVWDCTFTSTSKSQMTLISLSNALLNSFTLKWIHAEALLIHILISHLCSSGADRVGSAWPDLWCHRMVSRARWTFSSLCQSRTLQGIFSIKCSLCVEFLATKTS